MTKLISVVKNGIRKDLTIDEFNEIAKGGPGSGRHPYGQGAQIYFKERLGVKNPKPTEEELKARKERKDKARQERWAPKPDYSDPHWKQ